MLGIKLVDLEKTTGAVLNFESSIKDELAAELLLGKNLNLEKLRFAALTNDTKTVSEEVLKLVNQYGDTLQNNTLVSGAFAKTLGISKQEFADMVAKGKELNLVKSKFNSLGKDTIENLKNQNLIDEGTYLRLKNNTASSTEFYNALKQSIATSGQYSDVQARLNEILGETSAASLESQDIQAKFNDAIKRLQEAFSKFVDGGFLDRLLDGLIGFADWFGGGDLKADWENAKITTSKSSQTLAPQTSLGQTIAGSKLAQASIGVATGNPMEAMGVVAVLESINSKLNKPSVAYISQTEANKAITGAPTQSSKQTAR